ncbi:MAG: 16S rRNA (uracil(1498)-N(3))-methyltransferase [Anaerovoracaceae bacterium]
MPRFFIDYKPNKTATILGEDAKHIAKSLRMKEGEAITLCDGFGFDYLGKISFLDDSDNKNLAVAISIEGEKPTASEPTVEVTLFQGLPKSDKMDAIVQKSVELGVNKIIPTLTERCVSRPDEKSMKKKIERWQKISDEAAKQSGRGILPEVKTLCDFSSTLSNLSEYDLMLFCYEGGGTSILEIFNNKLSLDSSFSNNNLIDNFDNNFSTDTSGLRIPASKIQNIALFIGPEGGFSDKEVEKIKKTEAVITSLGPRILRTETAPIAALSAIMLLTANL